MPSSFSRLAPFIREYVYEKKWESLRDVQEAAAAAIFDRDDHVLIAAATASGKTEAAFFPVLSALWERNARNSGARNSGVGALCLSPLKALINDQSARLEPVAAKAEIPVWRWHGDAPQSGKKKVLEGARGILQITPESLEALLLRHPREIPVLFSGLAFIIIDEVHVFMGSERGNQVLCQLARIERLAARGSEPRRIGLSASLGDYEEALRWLVMGSGRGAVLVDDGKTERRLRIGMDYFSRDRGEEKAYYEALYRGTCGKKTIIFTNSRLDAEETITALRSISAKVRGNDRYRIHHGSIASELRMETEQELRESSRPVTAAATATLELGIDIGNLDRIIQIGPPASVGVFVQRLGRGGRRTGRAEIYFTELEENSPVLPWDLIRTIAVIELYLTDKWIEDAPEQPLPYSLLCHQILSVLGSLGEHGKKELSSLILSFPCFAGINGEDFDELAESLAASRVIEKTEEGALILGAEGERFTGHYSFYSVFPGSAGYRVLHNERELGKVNYLPPEGGGIILGGICWRVESVDPRRREIRVIPGEAGSLRVWRGGGSEIHGRVIRRMKQVLSEEKGYPYLFPSALSRLEEARRLFRRRGADPLSKAARGGFILLPWLGSRGMRTLLLLMQADPFRGRLGVRSAARESDYVLRVDSSLSLPCFREELRNILTPPEAPGLLVKPEQIPLAGKFDMLLPPRLLLKQYAANMLDWNETRTLLEIL
ncbi:MAG: DEAD/DEAH box helicase [Treponema sp.]|jgi:ATP-dependent Lhr-like helicase|nr:DEAD/DEAH box helicase [Treponema sp.]